MSLESADEVAQMLSPSRKPMADMELEELERDFFQTIARDAEVRGGKGCSDSHPPHCFVTHSILPLFG